ncbi:carboxypeptidase-like regulatory domain-containing protein [Croceitalea marina]|uniref:Carboxypeptidase-like regulatory domain-containing protein n=1 Tax=Croceitalea marina TaxID=1775166 RepID=A0ABW5MXG4_9FLAO
MIDFNTKKPIPFVNIGIIDAGVGTVSDEKGLFKLTLEVQQYPKDAQILFSALGYETFFIPTSNIVQYNDEYLEVPLKPSFLKLNEVIVSNKDGRFIDDNVGYRNYGEKSFGYWKNNIALGGELATKIKVKKGLRRLKKLEFEVWSNPSDSLLLRINFYEDDGNLGKPKTNLNTSQKNIYCTITDKDHIVKVDLEPFDIYVKDNFITSLELLKVYGENELGLILAAAPQYTKEGENLQRRGVTLLESDGNGSYRKYSSQDKWEFLSDLNMAYYIESELMVSEKVANRFERRMQKKKKKQQTISGFTLFNGRMVSGVSIFNTRTKDNVISDDKGRYKIPAKAKDTISFSKRGFIKLYVQATAKPSLNVMMKAESN